MKKILKDLQRYFTLRNVIIIAGVFVVSLIWFQYIAGLVMLLIFAPFTFLTVRYSKMVPHISIESFTSTALVMGYLYGPGIGFFYGVAVGWTSYIMNSFVNPQYLSSPVIAGLSAIIISLLKSLNVPFSTAFFIAICCRTAIAYPWYGLLGVDPIERMTHQVSQFFSNLIIYLPIMSAIIDFVGPFV